MLKLKYDVKNFINKLIDASIAIINKILGITHKLFLKVLYCFLKIIFLIKEVI